MGAGDPPRPGAKPPAAQSAPAARKIPTQEEYIARAARVRAEMDAEIKRTVSDLGDFDE